MTENKQTEATTSRLISHARRLGHLNRAQVLPAIHRQVVSTHSYNVAVMCMIVGDELRFSSEPIFNTDLTLSATTVRKALFHDVEESVVGDIPWHLKHHNEVVAAEVKKAAADLVQGVMPDAYFQEWKDSKWQTSGLLLGMLDMVEFGMWCADEIELGNYAVWGRFTTAMDWLRAQPGNNETVALMVTVSPTLKHLISSLEWVEKQYWEKVENWDMSGDYRHDTVI